MSPRGPRTGRVCWKRPPSWRAPAPTSVFSLADLSFIAAPCEGGRVLVGRPARNLKAKKPSDSGKTGHEGIRRIPPAHAGRAGLILLFAEKRPGTPGADEHNSTDILTSDFALLPPSHPSRF